MYLRFDRCATHETNSPRSGGGAGRWMSSILPISQRREPPAEGNAGQPVRKPILASGTRRKVESNLCRRMTSPFSKGELDVEGKAPGWTGRLGDGFLARF